MMFDVKQITTMQHAAIARWHQHGIDNPHTEFMQIACHQCSLNYLLWHEEDAARSQDSADAEIAQVKRTIDNLNQQRNDYIELMDGWLANTLRKMRVRVSDASPMNTETPGSVIDRLAILSLRIYHLGEQVQRDDVGPEHRRAVEAKLSVCLAQHQDLAQSLQDLIQEIFAGRVLHKVYHQFKMYNDPSLNPYLYQAESSPDPPGLPSLSQ